MFNVTIELLCARGAVRSGHIPSGFGLLEGCWLDPCFFCAKVALPVSAPSLTSSLLMSRVPSVLSVNTTRLGIEYLYLVKRPCTIPQAAPGVRDPSEHDSVSHDSGMSRAACNDLAQGSGLQPEHFLGHTTPWSGMHWGNTGHGGDDDAMIKYLEKMCRRTYRNGRESLHNPIPRPPQQLHTYLVVRAQRMFSKYEKTPLLLFPFPLLGS